MMAEVSVGGIFYLMGAYLLNLEEFQMILSMLKKWV
ncbi:MAG: hypothetical protein DDT42_00264 [candidate division WS2 bacterium]|uniref:Uncharacterized protein n=1 Tax=Psychracetigena formicireducens TaxID=2986056 RepID=A0A9E2BF20_PSYF1|nr:hypothetical protein [Candidatus Psychracetigena formicireducens]